MYQSGDSCQRRIEQAQIRVPIHDRSNGTVKIATYGATWAFVAFGSCKYNCTEPYCDVSTLDRCQ